MLPECCAAGLGPSLVGSRELLSVVEQGDFLGKLKEAVWRTGDGREWRWETNEGAVAGSWGVVMKSGPGCDHWNI